MTGMGELLALAERLERLTEPSRESDLEIQIALSGNPWRWADTYSFEPQTVITWDQYGEGAAGNPFCTLEAFTRSIDDAKTLLLDWMSVETCESAAPASSPELRFTRCRIWDWRRGPLAIDPNNEWKVEGNRPLPLNICAAVIRARASLGER
jgi:hypothetical protein